MNLKQTHTYAVMEVSPAVYDEIIKKLTDAGYEHAIMEDGTLDMHGIGLQEQEDLCEDEGCPQHGIPHVCINTSRLSLEEPEEWVPPIKTDPYAIYPEPSYVPKPSRPKQIVQRSKEDGYVVLIACMVSVVLIALILIASRR